MLSENYCYNKLVLYSIILNVIYMLTPFKIQNSSRIWQDNFIVLIKKIRHINSGYNSLQIKNISSLCLTLMNN